MKSNTLVLCVNFSCERKFERMKELFSQNPILNALDVAFLFANMCSISCENVKYVSFDSMNFKEREKINSHPLLDLTKSFSNERYGPVRLLKISF